MNVHEKKHYRKPFKLSYAQFDEKEPISKSGYPNKHNFNVTFLTVQKHASQLQII